MAEFASLISDLPLYQELDRAAGRDAIGKSDVAVLKDLVNLVADTAGPAMAKIPVTFRQYTVHDIRHCRNVIARMGDIIPAETRATLNSLEITFLLLAALLHDVGMVVTDHEKAETLRSEDFRRFQAEGHADRNKAIKEARAADNKPRARAIEDALLAEYYRRLHPERVRLFMKIFLAGRLQYRDIDFADDLARLCESHSWGVEESNDALHPEKAVVRLDDNVRLYGVRVNLQYLACILRLADILDFDRSRTPLVVFQHLDFSEPKSWEEWNKHLLVKGYEITPSQVAFDIPCTHPVFYVAVHEFLGWIDDELRLCRYLVENKPQATAYRYLLHLPHVVDRHKVRMADPSYVAGAFRFQMEYEDILPLLMKNLFPDPSLFLRELLRNALDACRRKEAEMEVRGLDKIYKPRISAWDRTDDPNDPRVVFQDNGIGMSQRIVEHYFLRVGRSYYRSPEFDAERQRLREHGKELDASSQSGIGILSCFLVGDSFEVETLQEGYDPLHILIEAPTKYFVMRRLSRPEAHVLYQKPSSDEEDGPPKRTGTRVTVHFRPGVKVDVWRTLAPLAAIVNYPITIYRTGGPESRTIQSVKESLNLPLFRIAHVTLDSTDITGVPTTNVTTPEIYVSYAWGEDSTAEGRTREEIVDLLCEAVRASGREIGRDKERMRGGDSITRFAHKISKATRIVAVISERSLHSEFCMAHELFRAYRRCDYQRSEFQEKVVALVMDDAKPFLKNNLALVELAEYWKQTFEKLQSGLRSIDPNRKSHDLWVFVDLMEDMVPRLPEMLAALNDIVMKRGFDSIVADNFKEILDRLPQAGR